MRAPGARLFELGGDAEQESFLAVLRTEGHADRHSALVAMERQRDRGQAADVIQRIVVGEVHNSLIAQARRRMGKVHFADSKRRRTESRSEPEIVWLEKFRERSRSALQQRNRDEVLGGGHELPGLVQI